MINTTDASEYVTPLVQAQALHDRAQALVNAGAAVNSDGALKIMNATIQLITKARRESINFSRRRRHTNI